MDEPDEQLLLPFLRTLGPIRVSEYFAASPEALWVDSFAREHAYHGEYLIWPTAFDWEPIYAQAETGSYYIRNTGTAPLLEYSRPDLGSDGPGRVYWAKRFMGEPAYDVAAFERWIDHVWRWVRRTARKTDVPRYGSVWVFPAARTRLGLTSREGAA